jgi:predicted Zn-dependent protease
MRGLIKKHSILAVLIALVLASAACGQAGAVTREEVVAGAERLYRERVEELAARQELDTDDAFLERLQQIWRPLLAQAAREQPETANWAWEIHSSNDADENAYCMAGGKIIVGHPFVQRLGLDDTELAMLLSHEMQHALLEHNLREFQEVLRIEPAWAERPFAELEYAVDHDSALMRKLGDFDAAQELDSDRAGLLLAVRAGWPPLRLANYYRKLSRASALPYFDSREHPAPARRWQAMRELAERLAAGQAP